MTFLVDTSVLSCLAPRRDVPRIVSQWIEDQSTELFLSVITLIEIEQGITRLSASRETRRAVELHEWLGEVTERFGRRIIPINSELALAVGRLSGHATTIGRHPGLADVSIAGTALEHGHTVLTRNRRHFEPLGVATLDPFVDPLP